MVKKRQLNSYKNDIKHDYLEFTNNRVYIKDN